MQGESTVYSAHMGCGFLLETEKDPGNQGFLGGMQQFTEGSRSSSHVLARVQRSVYCGFFHLPCAEPGGPLKTCTGRDAGVTPSALGAAGRRRVITSRKGCYRRWVYRPGWGERAGSTWRTGRRGPPARPACSSRAGTQRTGRKESHTGWACRSLADIWLACNSGARRLPGRGWTCCRLVGRGWT